MRPDKDYIQKTSVLALPFAHLDPVRLKLALSSPYKLHIVAFDLDS